MNKGLKPALPRSARDALSAIDDVAQEAGLPPAALAPRPANPPPTDRLASKLVQVNFRVRRSLGDQLADRARAEATTQKVLICRALAKMGFDVHADDLRAQPPARKRGAASG